MKNRFTHAVSIVWHIHQPLFIPDEEVLRQIRESYWVILNIHEKLAIPFTLNITVALLERFMDVDPGIITIIKRLLRKHLLELTGTGYYHPMLPLLSESDAQAHITKDKAIKKRVFQNKLSGFWPTDLGWVPWLVPLLREEGFTWVIVDSTSLTQSHALPQWKEMDHAGHIVLSPEIEAISLQEETTKAYKMKLDGKQIIIIVRNRNLSLELTDHKKGVIYQEHLSNRFAQKIALASSKEGIVLLAEDGERINMQTARGYERVLTALQKSKPVSFCTPSQYLYNVRNISSCYFPASTFQYDLTPWVLTMDDQTYLMYLRRAEYAVQQLEYTISTRTQPEAASHWKKRNPACSKHRIPAHYSGNFTNAPACHLVNMSALQCTMPNKG